MTPGNGSPEPPPPPPRNHDMNDSKDSNEISEAECDRDIPRYGGKSILNYTIKFQKKISQITYRKKYS